MDLLAVRHHTFPPTPLTLFSQPRCPLHHPHPILYLFFHISTSPNSLHARLSDFLDPFPRSLPFYPPRRLPPLSPSPRPLLSHPRPGPASLSLPSPPQDCGLKVKKVNPRQYAATIKDLPQLEVWLQRASDVVRRIRSGDLDMGILGYDMVLEYGEGDEDILIIHEALGFGQCHLGLGIPTEGKFADIDDVQALLAMPDWSPERPLRVVTGYSQVAKTFFASLNFTNYELCSADGALEAAPKMGYADIILDLVSTGTTLRENNLKEIAGARMVESQGVLVASRKALRANPELLAVVKEMLERLEAHLEAQNYYTVTGNMLGNDPKEIADRLWSAPGLKGLAGPTLAPVYAKGTDGKVGEPTVYAASISVNKEQLYPAVKALRKAGGSGVLVSTMTYIFNEETERWLNLLQKLEI